MMMDKDADSSEDNPLDDSRKVFVFLNYESSSEVKNLRFKVRNLGGDIVENTVTWDPRVTHVIDKTFVKSEIVLAGKC